MNIHEGTINIHEILVSRVMNIVCILFLKLFTAMYMQYKTQTIILMDRLLTLLARKTNILVS